MLSGAGLSLENKIRAKLASSLIGDGSNLTSNLCPSFELYILLQPEIEPKQFVGKYITAVTMVLRNLKFD